MKTHKKFKTSFYIDDALSKKMDKLLPERNKSKFINTLISEEISRIESEKLKKKAVEKLHKIKPVKRKTTALETLHKIRKEREKKLLS